MSKKEELAMIRERIIGSVYKVANTLGSHFPKEIYAAALAHEVQKLGETTVVGEARDVIYDGVVVGQFTPEIVVSGSVLVLIKTVPELSKSTKRECLNYLVATDLPLGLVINFGSPKVEIKRVSRI